MHPRTPGYPYRLPSRSPSTADEPSLPHAAPTAPAGTRMNPGEIPVPLSAPAPCRLLSALSGRPPSVPLAFWSRRLSSVFPLRAPEAGSRFPMTACSRVCRGSLSDPVRTLRSTARPLRPHLCWQLPSGMPPTPAAWECQTASASGRSLVPPVFRLTRELPADSPSPLLHRHYSGFVTTTRRSAPVSWPGTLPLAVSAA
jgi:hypothetical protein